MKPEEIEEFRKRLDDRIARLAAHAHGIGIFLVLPEMESHEEFDLYKERELFETHACKNLGFKKSQLGKHPDGSYKNLDLNRHSWTWRAARGEPE